MVGVIVHPFVDPTAAMVELSCNLGGWDSGTVGDCSNLGGRGQSQAIRSLFQRPKIVSLSDAERLQWGLQKVRMPLDRLAFDHSR